MKKLIILLVFVVFFIWLDKVDADCFNCRFIVNIRYLYLENLFDPCGCIVKIQNIRRLNFSNFFPIRIFSNTQQQQKEKEQNQITNFNEYQKYGMSGVCKFNKDGYNKKICQFKNRFDLLIFNEDLLHIMYNGWYYCYCLIYFSVYMWCFFSLPEGERLKVGFFFNLRG